MWSRRNLAGLRRGAAQLGVLRAWSARDVHLEANRTGGTVKRVHCGWAARCGVAAAELAARTLALPDAHSVEDLTALLTSAGEP
jgi:hypothetical protein